MAMVKCVATLGVAGVLCFSGLGFADTVVIDYSNIYTSSGSPSGSGPWARATFESTTPGTVTLELEAFLLTAEFVSNFFFNFDPTMNLAHLAIAQNTGPANHGISFGANGQNAGGGENFDINIEFNTANSQQGALRFNGTDTASFTFTSIGASTAGMTAASFNFGSVNGNFGPFVSAAHFQGLGPNEQGSAWISGEPTVVPLPPAAWAGLASLVGVGAFGYMRRRSMS